MKTIIIRKFYEVDLSDKQENDPDYMLQLAGRLTEQAIRDKKMTTNQFCKQKNISHEYLSKTIRTILTTNKGELKCIIYL